MRLVSANAFLGRNQEEQRGKPFRERDFRALEHGSDRDRELFAAFRFIALIKARTVSATL